MSVLAVLETKDSALARISLETAGAAARLAQDLDLPAAAVVLGAESDSAAQQAAGLPGIGQVYALKDPKLASYTWEGWTGAIARFLEQHPQEYILFPHTYQVRDFAPRLATRFGQTLLSDVIGHHIKDSEPVFTRQLFQGKLNADYRFSNSSSPCFVSVQAGAYPALMPSEEQARVEILEAKAGEQEIRSKPEEPFRESQRTVDLSSAPIIVAVGRGIKDEQNLALVRDLAKALGAELAASRPICDNGWLPMERQVGSSGQTVAPKLYLAIGISGAIQHLVGMKGSRVIAAVNKDPEAPIFEVASYGIVGDLFEVVPAIMAELAKK